MTYKLMIKTHKITGLKYLCITKRRNWKSYTGSGTYWKRHIQKHGIFIDTTLLFETESRTELSKVASQYSEQYNVVEDVAWANLIPEDGYGGDTASKKRWFTDGKEEIFTRETPPEGFYLGRNNNCVFKDKKNKKN